MVKSIDSKGEVIGRKGLGLGILTLILTCSIYWKSRLTMDVGNLLLDYINFRPILFSSGVINIFLDVLQLIEGLKSQCYLFAKNMVE